MVQVDQEGRRRASGLSLRSQIALLLAVLGGFLVATVALQLGLRDDVTDVRLDVVDRIDRSTEVLGNLRAAALTQQTAVRGFAITRDQGDLEPYERGGADGDRALAELRRLLPGDRYSDDLDAVRSALDDWQAAIGDPTAVPAGDLLEVDRERFDTLRTAIGRLRGDLRAERASRLADLDAAYDRQQTVIIVQAAILVLLFVIMAIVLSRRVLRPLLRLGRDVRRVAAGDLFHSVRAEGPPELVRLGNDVEAMRVAIVDELDQLAASQRDLERRTAELERSNADLEQFAYVASHDLQEPLRKVSGFCQLLEKRYANQLDDRAREYIWYASDGARRMQALINDLLSFSRVGCSTEAFASVDLDAVATEAMDLLADAIEQSAATVEVVDLPVVHGDHRLLVAVFQNLLGNAVKFRREEPPRVEVATRRTGDEWTITVSDNGIGIDPAYRDQIFTIFRRLHNRADYAGTGIGLALCKKILEFHGGRIWVADTQGPGTTIAFTLPVPRPAPPRAHAEASPPGDTARHRIRAGTRNGRKRA